MYLFLYDKLFCWIDVCWFVDLMVVTLGARLMFDDLMIRFFSSSSSSRILPNCNFVFFSFCLSYTHISRVVLYYRTKMNLITTILILCWLTQQVIAHTTALSVCQDATNPAQYLLLMHTYHSSCGTPPEQTVTFEETINGVAQGDRNEPLTGEACTADLAELEATGVCEPGTATPLNAPCDPSRDSGFCEDYCLDTSVKTGIMAFTPTALCGQSYGIELKSITGSVDYESCVPETAVPISACIGLCRFFVIRLWFSLV
jgi:hypothetical protein